MDSLPQHSFGTRDATVTKLTKNPCLQSVCTLPLRSLSKSQMTPRIQSKDFSPLNLLSSLCNPNYRIIGTIRCLTIKLCFRGKDTCVSDKVGTFLWPWSHYFLFKNWTAASMLGVKKIKIIGTARVTQEKDVKDEPGKELSGEKTRLLRTFPH